MKSVPPAASEGRQIMSTAEVSGETGVPVGTLRYWRAAGTGPRSWKLGRRVVYDRADITQWLDDQRATTSRGEKTA